MTAAEESAKKAGGAEAPKGCLRAKAPDGEKDIWVKPPRAAGPWWRVKHPRYGHRLVQAATEDEALRKFFEEFNPAMAADPEWCRQSLKLAEGRLARLPGDEPAGAPPAPARAKKS